MTPRTIDLVGGPAKFQEELEDLIRLSLPLEKHYPLVLKFLGDPWDDDIYTWDDPIWEMGIRQDIIRNAWMKCRIEVCRRLTGNIAQAYNKELVEKYGEPTQLRVTLFTES